ncbi:hypothetical protein HDF26_002290 [Pedobacter cryoconitis]|uniref:DUF1281 family ferredoxin-like fold protein n=1 Tax=Pedobacter cryoconitis TaxID=188932 RepID=UPI00160A3075|nr:hypothetical protein [Pedobacter cryoconitis]MBB6271833.1 hypothetical protein [Pedobacter cryoconitis]
MANWCFNMVVFQGEVDQLNKLASIVQKMINAENAHGKGQLFPMVKADEGYLFQITYQDGVLCYLTKWQPNTDVLITAADDLGLDYTHNYDEPAMGVYGLDIYKGGELKEAFITLEDYELYDFDESKSCYLYKGEEYEEINEVYDLILQEKLTDLSTNQDAL